MTATNETSKTEALRQADFGAWKFELRLSEAGDGYFVAATCNSRANWRKSQWFKGEDARANADRYFNQCVAVESGKAEARKAKGAAKKQATAAWVNPYKVGELLHYSWGYEQTQCEFAQVVEVKPRSLVLRRIHGEPVPGSQGFDSESLKPVKDSFFGESFAVRLSLYVSPEGQVSAYAVAEHGNWNPCGDREKFYHSWYG